jgi:hypothetical protein
MSASLSTGAIPFITLDDSGVFGISDEATAFLKTIKGKIAIVAIAGLYRCVCVCVPTVCVCVCVCVCVFKIKQGRPSNSCKLCSTLVI